MCPLSRFATVLISIAVMVTPLGARHSKRVQESRVWFLASSKFIRGTRIRSQDTYLVQLRFRRNGEKPLVRLAYPYPNQFLPSSTGALASVAGIVLQALLDPRCDLPYGEKPLCTAPGNPMAILLVPLRYREHLDVIPELSAVLPRHRTVLC